MRKRAVLSVASMLLVPVMAKAAALRVPEDYPSVLAGVDAAGAGDSVLVGPGTWTDHEVRTILYLGTPLSLQVAAVLSPGVTVIGLAGPTATVLDGGPQLTNAVSTVIHATAGNEPARIVGFTITGGGQGVTTGGSNVIELDHCRVTGNGHQGVGAREGTVVLADCLIEENELGISSNWLGGVWGLDVNATCTGCTFENNVGPGLHLSIAEWGGLTVVLRDCVFRGQSRRGAALSDVALLDIERCTFLWNSTTVANGGGLSLVRCFGTVRFSTFGFDSADTGGGCGVSLSEIRLENNTFVNCHADIAGGALSIGGTDGGVVGNIFANSTGRRGAVYKTGGPTHPDTGCDLFWSNADGDYYGDWVPAPTDIHADPLFCDPVILDFGLQAASPAAPPNSGGCGLIGAHEVSCGAVSVEPDSWGRIKNLYRSGPASGQGVAR